MDNNVLKQIKVLYNLPDVHYIEKVTAGFLSNNYILQNHNTKYFLKQYRHTTEEKIREIHAVKYFFARNDVPIILPILTPQGQSYFMSDSQFFALFPFINGKIIDRGQLSGSALINLGEMLAKIHILSKKEHPIISERVKKINKEKFYTKLNEIQSKLEQKERKTDFDQLTTEILLLKKEIVDSNTITEEQLGLSYDHLLHGDYHNQNIFFDENDRITHVFDLEKTEMGPRMLEIIRSMDYMCFNGGYEEKNFADAKIYLKAYSNRYPIPKEELKKGLAYYFITKAHSLWVETEHYCNDNTRVDIFLPMQLATIKYFSENLKEMYVQLAEIV